MGLEPPPVGHEIQNSRFPGKMQFLLQSMKLNILQLSLVLFFIAEDIYVERGRILQMVMIDQELKTRKANFWMQISTFNIEDFFLSIKLT